MKRYYTDFAVILTNFLAFLVVANLLCSAGLWAWNASSRRQSTWILQAGQKWLRYKDVAKIYPRWTVRDVIELQRDTEAALSARGHVYDEITQLRPVPLTSRFVNLRDPGFRCVKDQGPWPPDRSYVNIFVFGGSTTWGMHVDDEETIASYLQRIVSGSGGEGRARAVHVYNFGRPGYTSTQEMLLYFSLIRAGFAPRLAIFIDGLNDCQMGREAGLPLSQAPSLTIQYAIDSLRKPDSPWLHALETMPMVEVVKSFKRAKRAHAPLRRPDPSRLPEITNFVIERYLQNKTAIETLSAKSSTKCLFVWQPVPVYKYDLKYDPFGTPWDQRFHWGLPVVYPEIERMEAQGKLGQDFLNLSAIQENKSENLYVDAGHYTPEFSQDIARQIQVFAAKQKLLE